MSAAGTRRARGSARTSDCGAGERALSWPGDPGELAAGDIDFEAVAHVLANTCRCGGRSRRFYSLAQHSAIASEEIEELDGLGDEDRRTLALHALLADARAAWLGDGSAGGSTRAAERTKREGAAVDRAVREAAGLDPELPAEWAEILRFVRRMADAAARRDLPDADASGAGLAFPPLKRRILPCGPGRALRLWLGRFHALSGPPRGSGAAEIPPKPIGKKETCDVAHLEKKQRSEAEMPRPDREAA